jgi:AcrR family transcriptional regulator
MSSEKIENAFLSLIQKYNYENINISQICKEAHINRSTFYLHYSDINDLIIKIENKFAKNISNIFNNGLRQNNDAFKDMFTFIQNNKCFYKAFLNIPYTTLAESQIKLNILKNIGHSTHIDKSNNIGLFYRANFFGAGIKEICRLWLDRDCKESPQFMAALLLEEYENRDAIS